MSLSGMHIVIATVAAPQVASTPSFSVPGATLPFNAVMAKTMPSAAIFGRVPGSGGTMLIRTHCSVQAFVATSKVSGDDALAAAQDANRPRWVLEPNQDNDFYVSSGDYVAWAPA